MWTSPYPATGNGNRRRPGPARERPRGRSAAAIGEAAASMEEVAQGVVDFLRAHFLDKDTGEPALPLARVYLTKPCEELDPSVQDFARAAAADIDARPDLMCLTLLATAGEEPAGNDRPASLAHKAIPLPSVEALARMPLVAHLLEDDLAVLALRRLPTQP